MFESDMDEEGANLNVLGDRRRAASVRKGSMALLTALWREHPERMLAMKKAGFMVQQPDRTHLLIAQHRYRDHDPITGSMVIDAVSNILGPSYGEIIGTHHDADLVEARALVIQVLRARGWSYPKIGGLLGGRHQSSISHVKSQWSVYTKRNKLLEHAFLHLTKDDFNIISAAQDNQ